MSLVPIDGIYPCWSVFMLSINLLIKSQIGFHINSHKQTKKQAYKQTDFWGAGNFINWYFASKLLRTGQCYFNVQGHHIYILQLDGIRMILSTKYVKYLDPKVSI